MNQLNLQDLTQNELIEIILLQNKSHNEVMEIINEPKKDVMEDKPKKDVMEDKPKKDVVEDKPKKDVINSAQMNQIKETDKALKGHTKSYEISINNNKNPLEQLQNTRLAVKNHINTLLNEIKGLKFVET